MAVEQIYLDQVELSGTISDATTKSINVIPAYPHQPGRVVVIAVQWLDQVSGGATCSVTVGGVAATEVLMQQNGDAYSAIYRFHNPPTTTYAVVATWSATVNAGMAVYVLEQVDTASPVKNSGSNVGTGTSSSVALGTVLNAEFAVSSFAQFNATTTTACTTSGGVTADQAVLSGSSPLRFRAVSASALGSGGSLSPSHAPAASKLFSQVAVAMRVSPVQPLRGLMGLGV